MKKSEDRFTPRSTRFSPVDYTECIENSMANFGSDSTHHNKVRGFVFVFFYGATARGGPWSPLQYVSKPLDPLLSLHSFIPIFLRSVVTSSSPGICGFLI
jgi:hypothetical protein